jgi:hypothetical protein
LWVHFCKLVVGVRILQQRRITAGQLQLADELIKGWEEEFELKYYRRLADRLHLMRPSLHAILHCAAETVRCGPLNLVAQWALENTVGNLGREVKQPSNPFSNLSQRGLLRAQKIALKALIPGLDPPKLGTKSMPTVSLGDKYVLLWARDRVWCNLSTPEQRALNTYLTQAQHQFSIEDIQIRRWARLLLPNRHVCRCFWNEGKLEKKDNFRNRRNVKVSEMHVIRQQSLLASVQ